MVNLPDMKTPNQKSCTIGEMLEWCSQNNGVAKGRNHFLVQWTLANVSKLAQIAKMRWSQREWAMKALDDIEAIGVLDKLELLQPKKPIVTSLSKIETVAKAIGLHTYNVHRRLIITRNPLQLEAEDQKVSEPPSEFAIEIDKNAKPTELCTLQTSSANSND